MQDRANIHRGVEESGRPRLAHNQETAGSNPAPATTLNNPTRGSADSRPEDCSSPAPGAPSGLPSSPISFAGTPVDADSARAARAAARANWPGKIVALSSLRDPLTDPRPGDRVRVRSGMVAEVRGRLDGYPGAVSYAYANREGTHYAVAAVSAWRSLCRGGSVLAPEVQPGEAFDAVEVVR